MELHHVEGFAHEVVGACVDAGQALVAIVLRRDDDDGNEARLGLILEPPAHVEPVAARRNQIDDHEIRRIRGALGEHLIRGRDHRHMVPLAQQEPLQESRADLVVVGDENVCGCRHSEGDPAKHAPARSARS